VLFVPFVVSARLRLAGNRTQIKFREPSRQADQIIAADARLKVCCRTASDLPITCACFDNLPDRVRRFRSPPGICTPYLIGTALALLPHDKISCFSLTTSIVGARLEQDSRCEQWTCGRE
jgi:hypothetical protein